MLFIPSHQLILSMLVQFSRKNLYNLAIAGGADRAWRCVRTAQVRLSDVQALRWQRLAKIIACKGAMQRTIALLHTPPSCRRVHGHGLLGRLFPLSVARDLVQHHAAQGRLVQFLVLEIELEGP